MGILFFWLSCLGALASETFMLRISSPPVLEVFVLGLPHQKAAWDVTPTIRICQSSEVDVYRVSHASRYWEKLGYKFDGVYLDSSPTCMNPRFGEILVALPEGDFRSSHMASTKIYTHVKNNTIVKAKIYITPRNSKKQRVLEHEIGHALGWSHYNQKFHMMNSNWFLGGYDDRGLRQK